MKLKTLIVAGAILTISANVAKAEEQKDGFYLEPTIGIDYIYSDVGLKGVYDEIGDSSYNSGKLSVGARVHKNLGFEAFYSTSDSGKKTISNGVDSLSTKTSYDSIGVDAIGYLPVSEKIESFATFGIARYDYDVSAVGNYNGDTYTLSGSEDDWALSLGFGAQYEISENLKARLAYKHSFSELKVGGEKIADGVDEVSIGLRYNF